MARKTAKEEAQTLFEDFFKEAQEQLTHELRATRQPERILAKKSELDALDKVYERFYNWINGVQAA